MIYLDNAATTWPKPPQVMQALNEAMRRYGANPGRGGHSMGLAASQAVYQCRETAARMFHLDDPSGVIFTLNCTMSLNMVLKGILRNGGRVVVSSLEHNAVMRPLNALSDGEPVYDVARVVEGDDDATVENFRRCIRPSTRAIVCTHASNVFGVRLPITRLGALAAERGLLFVVDAAQTAGVFPIDMEADQIHFLCLAGHKGLYGPMGTGMLLCRGSYSLPPFIEGGTGSRSLELRQPNDLPERLESGTPNTPGICALRAGMELVMKTGVDTIAQREMRQITYLYDFLKTCDGIELYTQRPSLPISAPVLSLNIRNVPSERTAELLNRQGIAVRAGLHCAPSAHRHYGTLPGGTVRLAPSLHTTGQEIDRTCRTLWQLSKKLG
ncbi:MAG: aminotransferase class V-fold PLP-dependent enzyme [Clostridiales bacterium]|jgi:cysteine desulfurase family protein|nr:aminotransferase class V-fold PLP-dependent enzyme [Clostridiales bacterium]